MIVRFWQTRFDASQLEALKTYANGVFLPVLATRPGNAGVVFFSQDDRWTTMTFWDSQASIDGLANDDDYARIVAGIMELGVLGDEQQTTTHVVHGFTMAGQ